MKNIPFNFNGYVKVKFTEIGREEYRRKAIENMCNNPGVNFPVEPKTDQDGYSKIQVWELMRDFGHMVSFGNDFPFVVDDAMIEIDDKVDG